MDEVFLADSGLMLVSGGQTGADRAGLDWAIENGIRHGGWCPRGRKTEDGVLPGCYLLQETPTANYLQRTEWNVRDSDATLILPWTTNSTAVRNVPPLLRTSSANLGSMCVPAYTPNSWPAF